MHIEFRNNTDLLAMYNMKVEKHSLIQRHVGVLFSENPKSTQKFALYYNEEKLAFCLMFCHVKLESVTREYSFLLFSKGKKKLK